MSYPLGTTGAPFWPSVLRYRHQFTRAAVLEHIRATANGRLIYVAYGYRYPPNCVM